MKLQAQYFIDKDELFQDQQLSDFVLRFLLENQIEGATLFVGRSGYGKHQVVKRPNEWFSFDETPVVITFVDEADKVEAVVRKLRDMIPSGFLITHPVTVW